MLICEVVGPRAAPAQQTMLYHCTTMVSLASILAENELKALTTDVARGVEGPGVCFTTSYDYALRHKGRRSIVLVINAKGLATQSVDYWTDAEKERYGRENEQEEFLNGPLPRLRSRIISINSPQITFDQFRARVLELASDSEYASYSTPAEVKALRAYAKKVDADARFWNRWQPAG
jgi:hypothetical protein